MSPRSEEYLDHGRRRLAAARHALAGGHLEVAVSAAYYAMLNASRAALSEEDRFARTHKGNWLLMRETFVSDGRLDGELVAAAQAAQRARDDADYNAISPTSAQADAIVATAERFLAAVEDLLA